MRAIRSSSRIGCVATLVIVVLCCLLLFISIDPILNIFLGVQTAPIIPIYSGASDVRTTQQRIEYGGTRRTVMFKTTSDRDTVLAYYEQHLGPTRQAWKQDDFRGLRADSARLRTWSYQNHCPGTFVDLKYADSGNGQATVFMDETEYSCRDGLIVIIVGNIWPFH